MKSIVQLNTTGLTRSVSIFAFQFGTIPAPTGSNELIINSVPAGSKGVEIFWLNRDLKIPPQELIRYNLHFQIDLHNSAYLQIRLSPQELGTAMVWRWSAPIGFNGEWSSAEQQAPWYDDSMDYCINISPSNVGIDVSLSEHSGTMKLQCAFIPAEQTKHEMLRLI
jgi:hypothetical protein